MANSNTSDNKKRMLKALEDALGVVSMAARTASIDRSTHYQWLKDDENYAAQVESIKDIAVDFAESKLHMRIKEGSDTAIIFFLKTQAKARGYVEKQQIDHTTDGEKINVPIINVHSEH